MSENDTKIRELLARIEEGTKAVFQGEEYKKYLRTISNFHHYSFRNSMLIFFSNPDATLVAGFNTWKKLNRTVKRGETGIQILAPAPKTIWVNERVLDPDGNPVLDQNGKQVYEKHREKIPAYKPVFVFDVSQTIGEPLPEFGPRMLTEDVANYDDLLSSLREISPLPISFEHIESGEVRGYCSFAEEKIVVQQGMPPAQSLKTAVHEIAHAFMHDPKSVDVKSNRQTKEVEAESVAFIVCSHLGLDTADYTFPYLAGWSGSQELYQLHASLDRIQHQANEMIQRIDARMLELQREAPERSAPQDPIAAPAKGQQPVAPPAVVSRTPENVVSETKKPQRAIYSQEQIDRAAATDLEAWLESQGEKLLKSGRESRLDRDHSVTVRGNQWFDHSEEKGGNAITFVQQFYNLSFPEAVKRLLSGEPATYAPTDKEAAPTKAFTAPERHTDMRRVFAYLTKTREIDPAVVQAFAKAGTLYEDAGHHNAVFLGLDGDGVARHAHARSTYTGGQSIKLNLEGSDARYSFHHVGSSQELFVFEAPIDLLSYISLNSENWQQHSYVACCGLSLQAVQQQLREHTDLSKIHLCLDNDEAGRRAAARMQETLAADGFSVILERSIYKDWNEDLVELHFYEAEKNVDSSAVQNEIETQRRENERLDAVKFDNDIDLDKERTREQLGYRDNDPASSKAPERLPLSERLALAAAESERRAQAAKAVILQMGRGERNAE